MCLGVKYTFAKINHKLKIVHIIFSFIYRGNFLKQNHGEVLKITIFYVCSF